MKVKFTGNEIIVLVISAVVLGFVFGFDDGSAVFNAQNWFSNYASVAVISFLIMILFVLAQKTVAARYGATTEYALWKFRRFGFSKSEYVHQPGERAENIKSKAGIPLGIILPIIIAFLSEGKTFFAATGITAVTAKAAHRLGRPFISVTDMETAKSVAAGPIAVMILALALSLISNPTELIKNSIVISVAIAISNILPLPKIAGGTVFFASKFFYIFALVFVGVSALIVWFVNAIIAGVLALVLAIITVTFVYYYMETKK